MQMDPVTIVFTILVLIISVIVHEIAHGYAANWLGDPTAKLAGRLTLNPVSHVDPVGSILVPGLLIVSGTGMLFGWAKPVPYNPYNLSNQRWGEAIVAVAGSATNLFLALLFGLLVRYGVGVLPDPVIALSATIALINLFLGLFNLIPIPPFDGFTVLRSVLPYRLAAPLRNFEDRLQMSGVLSLILVLFLFVYFLSEPFSYLVTTLFSLLIGA